MGKGNKNRNAYFYFMQDFKTQQGRNFKSMAEVADAASPHWQRMTPQQKKKYEDMAKQNKENQFKQTSIGESVDLVLKEEKEKLERERRMKKDVDTIIKNGINAQTIENQDFYLMHINDFCYWEKGNKYYPAEIALGKFNLRNGIRSEEVYHALVQPGPLPLGYSGIAKIQSEETHQIQHMGDDNNMEEVLMNIISKLSEDVTSDNFPPIFVSEKDVLIIENVLDCMCEDFDQRNIFTLYSLQYLLYALKNSIYESVHSTQQVWPTISVSKLQLEKDVYDFCTGIACAYHESSEIPVHCSRSRIIRWAYIICDNCVQDLELPMIPGRHVPANALTSLTQLGAGSSTSRRNSESYAPSVGKRSTTSNYESDTVSVTSTVAVESASSYHGFDSDSQVSQTPDDEEGWRRPRRPQKQRAPQPQNLSQQSDVVSQLSQTSSNAEYIPGRRPLSKSAAAPGATRSVMPGRGRGRGILPTRPPI